MLIALPALALSAPVNVDLTQFTTAAGTRFYGAANSRTGSDLSFVGDHNGDGFADYVFGAFGLNTAIIVMKRDTTNADLSVPSITSDQYFRVIKGPTSPSSSFTGMSVGGAGDVNGDSFDDVIICAPGGTVTGRGGAGFAFVVFGMQGPFTDLILTAEGPNSSLGFMILGPASGFNFGSSPRAARGVGDVNGDGIDDLAVAARWYPGTSSKTKPGVVWIIFGKNTTAFTTIDTVPANFTDHGIYYTGAANGNSLGTCIMPAGDFNADGIDDFLIGASESDVTINGATRTWAGITYLVYGSKTALVNTDMSTFTTGSMGVRFFGAGNYHALGRAFNAVGDVNGDGFDDIALGASSAPYPGRASAGAVYVLFGSSTMYTADVDMLTFAASPLGFAIYGRAQGMELCTAAPAGDMDGDGINDILVGGVGPNSRAHIVYGQKEARTAHVDTLTGNVTTFYFTNMAQLSYALDGGQDINGDGGPDILLGAYTAGITPASGGASISSAGAVWMIAGTSRLSSPTVSPTSANSSAPSAHPSQTPSCVPSFVPSYSPSVAPSGTPSEAPSMVPSAGPSVQPSFTGSPTMMPSTSPSAAPTCDPTVVPSVAPSIEISQAPSKAPTTAPSGAPSARPTATPYEVQLGVQQVLFYEQRQLVCITNEYSDLFNFRPSTMSARVTAMHKSPSAI